MDTSIATGSSADSDTAPLPITAWTSGCPGMAKGGSGDALTGMTGALIAQKLAPEVAAYVGSQLHGLAGEAAEEEFGERGMLATDLVEMISEVLI